MSLIEVSIRDEGEHWHKRISLFGIPLYHRHDFTKDAEKKCVGFNVYPSNLVEVEVEDYYPEECKRKSKKK